MDRFRVIVAGGRDFDDYSILSKMLDFYLSNIKCPIVIVCGKAKGADSLGERYAIEHNYHVDSYPADWKRWGKKAGFIRNEVMARNADALIAFWDGESRGTKNMINIAKRYNLSVRIVHYEKI